jgi:hypothetical protein
VKFPDTIGKKGLTMLNPMIDFENFDGHLWILNMCPNSGFIGLENISLNFYIVQTKIGTINEIVKEGLFLQEQIKKKQREFRKFINILKQYNDNLRVLGDIDYINKMTNEVQNFKKILETA